MVSVHHIHHFTKAMAIKMSVCAREKMQQMQVVHSLTEDILLMDSGTIHLNSQAFNTIQALSRPLMP
jgi:hypothetical protein